MSETRNFIPTGKCVEEEKAFFTHPATTTLAKQACLSCVQLEFCQDQQETIGAILRQRGEENPVVGGDIPPESSIDISNIEQFGEVTLRFDRERLPEDGTRALRSQQQAIRAGQVAIKSFAQIKNDPLDITTWLHEQVVSTHPEAVASLSNIELENILREIKGHILIHGRTRLPGGKLKSSHQRYNDINLEDYRSFAHAFIQESTEYSAMGLHNPARATSYHAKNFYDALLQEMEQYGISHYLSRFSIKKAPLDPLSFALKRKAATDPNKAKGPEPTHNNPIDALSNINSQKKREYVGKLFDYGIIEITPETNHLLVGVGKIYSGLDETEKAAILHALNLADLAHGLPNKASVAKALRVDNLEDFVFTVLAPYANPKVLQLDTTEGIDHPSTLLQVSRLRAWGKKVKYRTKVPSEIMNDHLLNGLSSQQKAFWAKHQQYIHQLYATCRQIAQQANNSPLSTEVFHQIFTQYRLDAEHIMSSGAKHHGPQIAFFYTPQTYIETAKYLKRNTEVTQGFVNACFKGYSISPIVPVRRFEEKYTDLKQINSPYLDALMPSDLKEFAQRGLTEDKAIEAAKALNYVKAKLNTSSNDLDTDTPEDDSSEPAKEAVTAPIKTYPSNWILDGACKGEDPDLFYPDDSNDSSELAATQAEEAKKICSECPVKLACLKTAIDNDDLFGVSGGIWWEHPEHTKDYLQTLVSDITIKSQREEDT